jgi:hypothetical protein
VDGLQAFNEVFKWLVGVGLLGGAMRMTWLVRDIKAIADETGKRLDSGIARIEEMLRDHETRIRVVEKAGNHHVIYDGPDRRKHEERDRE